jgi:hypothetical protein
LVRSGISAWLLFFCITGTTTFYMILLLKKSCVQKSIGRIYIKEATFVFQSPTNPVRTLLLFVLFFLVFFWVWLRSSGSTSRYTNNWGDRETFQHKFVSILPLFVFLFSFNLKIFHLFFNRNDFKIKNKRRRWRQSCVCARGNIRRAFDWTVDP